MLRARVGDLEPRHGEVWCRVKKSVKNWHDPVDALLKKTVKEIGAGVQF